MAFAAQEELSLIASSVRSTPWLQLPSPTCDFQSCPLHIKLYQSAEEAKLLLLAVSLYTGDVFFENLIEARSIHVRMRISSRDDDDDHESQQRDSQSQISRMEEGEAVSVLCVELSNLLSYALTEQDARFTARGDQELEITFCLPSLPFKFRLDKASPRLTARILNDLLLKPLLGVTNAMITAGVTKLEEHAHTIDEAAKKTSPIEGVLCSAMHRYSQAIGGIAKSSRSSIIASSDRPQNSTKEEKRPLKTQRGAKEARQADADMCVPAPTASPPTTRKKFEERAETPEVLHPAPGSDVEAGPTAISSAKKGKKAMDRDNADSDATEASDNESILQTTRMKQPRSTSPSSLELSKKQPRIKKEVLERSKDTKSASRDPSPAEHTSPIVPTVRRPTSQMRGIAKRGKRGSQWTNFG